MIDPRLRSQNAYLVDMDERICLAKKVMEQPWYPAARDAVAGYLTGLLSFLAQGQQAAEDDQVKAYCDSAPVTSFFVGTPFWLEDFSAELQHALCEPHGREHGAAHWCIGQALVDALVRRDLMAEDISRVAHLVGAHDVRIFAFTAAVEELSGSAFEFLVRAVALLVDQERSTAERHLPPRGREGLGAARETWAAEADFGAIWDARAWIGMDMYSEELGILGGLCAQKPDDFLSIVEHLELPPFVESVLRSPSITMDMDRLLELLSKAPAILDPASNEWNRKVVAAFLLELAFEHVFDLGRLNRSNDDMSVADEREIKSLASTIVEHALGRVDGVPLMIRWMCHMTWRKENRQDDALLDTIYSAALDVLARSSVPISDVYALPQDKAAAGTLASQLPFSQSEVLFRQLVLAVMLEQKRNETGAAESSALRAAFCDLLRRGREAFRPTYNERAASWRHHVFSRLYLHERQPAKAWRTDFDAFSLERRASLHWTYTDDRTLAASSLFHAGVGVALLEQCCEAPADSSLRSEALHIWQQVFEATRPFFIDWSLNQDQWRVVASGLFARLPACALAGDRQLGIARAREALYLLGSDETLFATALANLDSNGLRVDELATDETEVATMMKRIQNYLQWESASGSRNLAAGVASYWAKNLPPHLVALVAKS